MSSSTAQPAAGSEAAIPLQSITQSKNEGMFSQTFCFHMGLVPVNQTAKRFGARTDFVCLSSSLYWFKTDISTRHCHNKKKKKKKKKLEVCIAK